MSEKIIPFFSARKTNKVQDYIRFFHTKSYIQQKSLKYPDTRKKNPVVVELMQKSGYNNLVKFRKHRNGWDDLKRKIPVSYLENIEVDLEGLKFTCELDRKEFETVLNLPLRVKYLTAKFIPGVYQSVPLPYETDESEAIEMAKFFSAKEKMSCSLNFTNLKSIYVEPNGKINIYYYTPEIKFSKNFIKFSGDGSLVGICKIK